MHQWVVKCIGMCANLELVQLVQDKSELTCPVVAVVTSTFQDKIRPHDNSLKVNHHLT